MYKNIFICIKTIWNSLNFTFKFKDLCLKSLKEFRQNTDELNFLKIFALHISNFDKYDK